MKRKKNPNSNWIKLNRAIMDDWIWKGDNTEPFDMRSAWVDLLLLAYSHDEMRVSHGQPVIVKRGQVPYSQRWLADRWGWSRGKVRRFLSILEKDQKIRVDGTNRNTMITIEKYAFWQDARPSDSTSDGTSDEPVAVPVTDTVKNNKNNRYIEGGGRRQKNNSGRLDWIDEL